LSSRTVRFQWSLSHAFSVNSPDNILYLIFNVRMLVLWIRIWIAWIRIILVTCIPHPHLIKSGSASGSASNKNHNPDPHKGDQSIPDPHLDLHQSDADPKHWFTVYMYIGTVKHSLYQYNTLPTVLLWVAFAVLSRSLKDVSCNFTRGEY
jgi:hypothetical protein